MTSYDEIQRLRSSKDPEDRRKCIALLSELLSSDALSTEGWFDLASCHDYLGEALKAEPAYESAVKAGVEKLPIEKQPRLFLQFGSTLRNNGKLSEAISILQTGVDRFPEHAALHAFLALALHSSGEHRNACRSLASAIIAAQSNGWDGYERAIHHYFNEDVLSD